MIPVKDNIPVDRFPFVTLGLILAQIGVYAAGATAAPTSVTTATLFSSMFTHTAVVQLIGNVWFLWLFGGNVEDSMGPVRFLAFYVAGGLVATGVAVAADPGLGAPTVGSAGAVAAVIGGYLLLYPRARMVSLVAIPFFFGVAEIPTLVMLGAWVAMQAAFAAAGWIGHGAAAYLSYLGGFAFGLAGIRLLAKRRKPMPPTAAAYR